MSQDPAESPLLGGRLLPPAQLAAMQTVVPVPGTYRGYGLGLQRIEIPCVVWGHRGRLAGYTSWAFARAGGQRVVVLLVNSGGLTNAARAAAADLVATTACGRR